VAEALARAGLHEPALEAARRSDDHYRAWGLHAIARARALEGDLDRALDTALSIEGWERGPADARSLRAALAAMPPPPPSAAPVAIEEPPPPSTLDLRSLHAVPPCARSIDALGHALTGLLLSAGEAELDAARQAARALTNEPCAERPRLDETLFDSFSWLARRGLEDAAAFVAAELTPELRRPARLGLALGLAECGQGDAARARLADGVPEGR
jgi:hypothetical protein